jgi:hypothetical protein
MVRKMRASATGAPTMRRRLLPPEPRRAAVVDDLVLHGVAAGCAELG